jgi:uncharacterized protein
MNYFLCRLNSPRATFPNDISDEERQLMQRHALYWKGLLDKRKVLLFGPVGDPAGVWGVAIVEVSDSTELQTLIANDPVIISGQGFSYDVFPVSPAMARP